jgi:hypothetical protein
VLLVLSQLNRFNKGIFQELYSSRKHKLRTVPHWRGQIGAAPIRIRASHLSFRTVGIISTVSTSSLKSPNFIRNARLAHVV